MNSDFLNYIEKVEKVTKFGIRKFKLHEKKIVENTFQKYLLQK